MKQYRNQNPKEHRHGEINPKTQNQHLKGHIEINLKEHKEIKT